MIRLQSAIKKANLIKLIKTQKQIFRTKTNPLKANLSPINWMNINSYKYLSYKPIYRFSEDKSSKQPKQPKQTGTGISISDIYKSIEEQIQFYSSKLKRYEIWQIFSIAGLLISLYFYINLEQQEHYPKNYFQEQLKNKSIPKIQVQIGIDKDKEGSSKKYYINYGENYDQIKQLIDSLSPKPQIQYIYTPKYEVKWTKAIIAINIISIIFITAFFLKSSAIGGVRKGGKSQNDGINKMLNYKKQFQVVQKSLVKFKDVAGLNQSKVQVKQFVDFLKNPKKYTQLGARIPKGILLTGPPGTGKTMLAKACAGEAGVPFIATSGSDFVEIFVGVGASRVRQLFSLAKSKAPSIIFIDQIDAVGRKRSGTHGSHDQRDNTLNQILVEMDGFQTQSNVIVMAATNRQNLLDNALIRPGRFDRIVQVNLPDLEGRRVHVNSARTKDQYAQRLATLTPGFSGAEIANLCNQAAILAARHGKTSVDSHDLQMATQRIIGGVQRRGIISKQQKRVVSVHESGHAVVSWFLQGADPLLKLTIIPRSKGSLGFAQYFVNETKLNTKSQLLDRICFILGGRCAQQHFFKKITNGASDDLKKAYQIAHNIVVKLGMNNQIGYIGFRDPQFLRTYSQQMGAIIDKEIQKILQQCTKKTRQMIIKHQHHIKQLSDQLLQKETLTIREIRRILGQREYSNGETYQKYLQIQRQENLRQIPPGTN